MPKHTFFSGGFVYKGKLISVRLTPAKAEQSQPGPHPRYLGVGERIQSAVWWWLLP